MSYQEKRNFLSIFTTILILTIYSIYIFTRYQQSNLDMTEDLSFWGLVILIFIPISIAASLGIEILFNIFNTIITKEEEDPCFTDERDKLIEIKAMRISYGIVGVGFLLSMLSLVIKMPTPVMLNIVFFSFYFAEIFGSIVKIYYYRRGI